MNDHVAGRLAEVKCGACGERADCLVGTIPFYLKGGELETSIWRCEKCGSYTRDLDFDDPLVRSHFDVASYTNPDAEESIRTIRSEYFQYLTELIQSRIKKSLHDVRVLDVGISYGHFLGRLRDSGARPEGVEIVAALREMATKRGLLVHGDIPPVENGTFDIITAIDSIYYVNHPLLQLKQLRLLLKPDGHLFMRIANRTWLLDWRRALGLRIGSDHFGDAKVDFSIHGIIRLIEKAGFAVEEIVWAEKGKADPRGYMRFYYWITPLLSEYLSLRITPGVIVIARPMRLYYHPAFCFIVDGASTFRTATSPSWKALEIFGRRFDLVCFDAAIHCRMNSPDAMPRCNVSIAPLTAGEISFGPALYAP